VNLPALPPAEFGVALDPAVRRPRPDVLVGGHPIRVLRLRPAGGEQVDAWERGGAIGPTRAAGSLARRLFDAGIAHPCAPVGAGPPVTAVTVVIPVRDRPGGLASTLDALAGVAGVIVVDDGSRHPVPAAGRCVIRHHTPRGPAAARNTGWRAARTPFVAFVDADCAPAPGWLTALLPDFADDAVGAVAPRIVTVSGPGTPAVLAAYERCRSPLDLGRHPAAVRPGSPVPYVPTAALIVRRQALLDASGLDEGLRFGEDVDLVWRLHRLGWRVRYQPATTVTHPARSGFGPWLDQRFHYGRSAPPLASRHGRAVAPVALSPWTAAAWGLAVSGHPAAGALVVAATSAALARRAGPDRATARTLAGLALTGNLRGGAALAGAVRRAWLPPAVAGAALSARLGRRTPALALAAALVIPPVAAWVRQRPAGLGPLTWSALCSLDDLAYQAGVWAGVVESRSAAALLPDC
jgi:mycofactocin system glycosyltransferase